MKVVDFEWFTLGIACCSAEHHFKGWRICWLLNSIFISNNFSVCVAYAQSWQSQSENQQAILFPKLSVSMSHRTCVHSNENVDCEAHFHAASNNMPLLSHWNILNLVVQSQKRNQYRCQHRERSPFPPPSHITMLLKRFRRSAALFVKSKITICVPNLLKGQNLSMLWLFWFVYGKSVKLRIKFELIGVM